MKFLVHFVFIFTTVTLPDQAKQQHLDDGSNTILDDTTTTPGSNYVTLEMRQSRRNGTLKSQGRGTMRSTTSRRSHARTNGHPGGAGAVGGGGHHRYYFDGFTALTAVTMVVRVLISSLSTQPPRQQLERHPRLDGGLRLLQLRHDRVEGAAAPRAVHGALFRRG